MKESVTKFDFNSAFKALDEIDIPSANGLVANKAINEAICTTPKTDCLIEEYIDLQNTSELQEASEEREAEIAKAKLSRIEKIVDLDAETEEDILPSYVGKIAVQCPQCMTMFYKDEQDLVHSDEDVKTVNIGEKCQHCGNDSGYTVIGRIEEVKDDELANYETEETPAEDTEENINLAPVEEPVEEVEETTEEETVELPAANEVEETEEEVKEESIAAPSGITLTEQIANALVESEEKEIENTVSIEPETTVEDVADEMEEIKTEGTETVDIKPIEVNGEEVSVKEIDITKVDGEDKIEVEVKVEDAELEAVDEAVLPPGFATGAGIIVGAALAPLLKLATAVLVGLGIFAAGKLIWNKSEQKILEAIASKDPEVKKALEDLAALDKDDNMPRHEKKEKAKELHKFIDGKIKAEQAKENSKSEEVAESLNKSEAQEPVEKHELSENDSENLTLNESEGDNLFTKIVHGLYGDPEKAKAKELNDKIKEAEKEIYDCEKVIDEKQKSLEIAKKVRDDATKSLAELAKTEEKPVKEAITEEKSEEAKNTADRFADKVGGLMTTTAKVFYGDNEKKEDEKTVKEDVSEENKENTTADKEETKVGIDKIEDTGSKIIDKAFDRLYGTHNTTETEKDEEKSDVEKEVVTEEKSEEAKNTADRFADKVGGLMTTTAKVFYGDNEKKEDETTKKESLVEAKEDTKLEDALSAHNEYIKFLQDKIETHKKELETAKNEEVKAVISKQITDLEAELKAALPEAVAQAVIEDDLPTPEETDVTVENESLINKNAEEYVDHITTENRTINESLNVSEVQKEAEDNSELKTEIETENKTLNEEAVDANIAEQRLSEFINNLDFESEAVTEDFVDINQPIRAENTFTGTKVHNISRAEAEQEIKDAKAYRLGLATEDTNAKSVLDLKEDNTLDVSEEKIEKMLDSKEFSKPVSDKEVTEILGEKLDLNLVEDIDEESFNSHLTEALTKVYENVDKFVSESCSIKDNKLIIEGKIYFKSGNVNSSKYIFESKEQEILNGLNEEINEISNIDVKCKLVNKCLFVESLKYKYTINENLIEGSTTLNEGLFDKFKLDEIAGDVGYIVRPFVIEDGKYMPAKNKDGKLDDRKALNYYDAEKGARALSQNSKIAFVKIYFAKDFEFDKVKENDKALIISFEQGIAKVDNIKNIVRDYDSINKSKDILKAVNAEEKPVEGSADDLATTTITTDVSTGTTTDTTETVIDTTVETTPVEEPKLEDLIAKLKKRNAKSAIKAVNAVWDGLDVEGKNKLVASLA